MVTPIMSTITLFLFQYVNAKINTPKETKVSDRIRSYFLFCFFTCQNPINYQISFTDSFVPAPCLF